MRIHLVIVQPEGYVHSLGFLDTADYMQYWLKKQGLQVSVAKNRLRHDAVNIVFGAHLGFNPEWLQGPFCTFFFNLEQIGQGGARTSPAYQELLRVAPIIDYHPDNVASYRLNRESVPLIQFLNAPYLNPENAKVNLASRPIDLLFFGSINNERKAFIKRIEKVGIDVAVFDSATYYKERDIFISQAKAVINTSFYSSARFEQVRAFNVLSLGTAFISFLQPGQKVDAVFRDPVFWIDEKNFDVFFKEEFGKEGWCLDAQQKLSRWHQTNPEQSIKNLIKVLDKFWKKYIAQDKSTSHPRKLVQATDGKYFQDALNLSPYEFDEADLTMDLCNPIIWPWTGVSRWGQSLRLDINQFEHIVMRQAPEKNTEWQALLTNSMRLLNDNGQLILEFHVSNFDVSGIQGPQLKSGKSVVENFTDKFWRGIGITHRFEHTQSAYLDEKGQHCEKEKAQACRLVLVKRLTTPQERTKARVALPNFGRNFC
jgi:hypothetical protein